MTLAALTPMRSADQSAQSSRLTWIKLGIAVVAVSIALAIFKIAFAWPGTFFLTAFGSFVTVIAISVVLYYVFVVLVFRSARKRGPDDQS